MHTRDLRVPVQDDVVAQPSPDRHFARWRQRNDHLSSTAVAVQQERLADSLRLDPRLELGRRRGVSRERLRVHQNNLIRVMSPLKRLATQTESPPARIAI